MVSKRKRNQLLNAGCAEPNKRRRVEKIEPPSREHIQHPTLSLYYRQISTLRDYIVSTLPKTSKTRRRKISSVGKTPRRQPGIQSEAPNQSCDPNSRGTQEPEQREINDTEAYLGSILDNTLVCVADGRLPRPDARRAKDFETFSQHANLTAGSSFGEGNSSQSDLIDFAIWLLFHKVHRNQHRPPHMLCHGYQRTNYPREPNEDHAVLAGIPGLVSYYPNSNITTLRSAGWCDILRLLGKEGDPVMLDMILECGIFVAIDGGRGNFYQLSGTPMTELQVLVSSKRAPVAATAARTESATTYLGKGSPVVAKASSSCRSPSSITFVRSRMFYARAALNAKGKVTTGLRHIHVLNRYPDASNEAQTLHVMKYVFPRQFGLHNVFTSTVDARETAQPFKDYTLREQEVAQIARVLKLKSAGRASVCSARNEHIPKRLRGKTLDLVRKLQKLHSRCSYSELLKHYCPLERSRSLNGEPGRSKTDDMTAFQLVTQLSRQDSQPSATSLISQIPSKAPTPSLVDLATPHADVSAFCRAALSKVVPRGFWGDGDQGQENEKIVMDYVDRFVRLRRFESFSLHLVFQRLKLKAMSWLVPPNVDGSVKSAMSDMQKRRDILLEFLYYVFDSILIPLIRSNFHVTESNVHQNRLFYFRHDLWRALTEPAMNNLKLTMFEEIKTPKARRLLDTRPLGFSQIRLLPKGNGVRPITNLRRRATKLQNGKVTLGRSINSVMAPVFNVLDFEKKKNPELVGSALFSVGEMYTKLKAYGSKLDRGNDIKQSIYFAKADAKSCFDRIPQRRVVKLIEQIASEHEYRIARHSEFNSSRTHYYRHSHDQTVSKPARKFISTARAASDFADFDEVVQDDCAAQKRNTIFVDSIVQQPQKREKLLDLLEEHVQRNVIKIGKKFFRQKSGIPQGSVLSSFLCNYFYADLEKVHLSFLEEDESLLLRLIDDFLLITTNKDHAKRFLQIMHDGIEEYGLEVNPAKSLANFGVTINGHQVPRQLEGMAFPYCGNAIDTRTLEITKDRNRRKATVLADTLTVEPSKTPGRTFYRKALNAFKIQTHKMFLDTSFNSPETVLSTIYQNFRDAAMKYYRYAKSMTSNTQPHSDLLIGTISDLIDLAFVLIKAKHKNHMEQEYRCAVSKRQVRWLAVNAFRNVLGRKQSKYMQVIEWLDGVIADVDVRPGGVKEAARLRRIVRRGDAVFQDYDF